MVSYTFSADSVPAPTAQASVRWSLTVKLEAEPHVGSSGFAIGTRDPNAQGNPITEPVAGFPICPGMNGTASCSSGTYALQCDISVVPDAPTQRAMRCTDNRGNVSTTQTFAAGEYDFVIEALAQIGAFPSTRADRRYGRLCFE